MKSIADFLLNSSNKTSFLGDLLKGAIRADLIFPFPAQEKDSGVELARPILKISAPIVA